MSTTIKLGAVAFALLLVAHHADYLLQAYHWSWNYAWWDLDPTAAKWGFWDFIPHDSWHIVQSIFHLTFFTGGALSALAALSFLLDSGRVDAKWHQQAVAAVIFFGINALARGIGFSLVRTLTQGY